MMNLSLCRTVKQEGVSKIMLVEISLWQFRIIRATPSVQ